MKRINAILGSGAESNPEMGPIDDYWDQVIQSHPELAVDIRCDPLELMKRQLD